MVDAPEGLWCIHTERHQNPDRDRGQNNGERLGPYPGSGVMCESVHTVSYNPFVPGPCPGLSSGRCEYAIVEDRGRLRDSLAASLNLKMCLYQTKATLLQTKYSVLVLIFPSSKRTFKAISLENGCVTVNLH